MSNKVDNYCNEQALYLFIHTVALREHYFRDANLGDFDTASQARDTYRYQFLRENPLHSAYVSQYRVDPSRILSLPASNKAFSSAWRQRQVDRSIPALCPLLHRGPIVCQRMLGKFHIQLDSQPPSLQFLRFRGVPL